MFEWLSEWWLSFVLTGLWGTFGYLVIQVRSMRHDTQRELADREKLWSEELIRISNRFDRIDNDHSIIRRELEKASEGLTHSVDKLMDEQSKFSDSMYRKMDKSGEDHCNIAADLSVVKEVVSIIQRGEEK